MSLKGSLQTVALPEVLQFLSSTGKSGEFHVTGSHGEGRLWFENGHIAGFDAGASADTADAIFELLRVEDGEFSFAAGVDQPEHARRSDDGDVSRAIEVAETRLTEWREIVAVVPSVRHQLRLRREGPSEGVVLNPEQWSLVVAIAGGRSVSEVLADRGLSEFTGCRAVRDLVESALVDVEEPATVEDETATVEDEVDAHQDQQNVDAFVDDVDEEVVVDGPVAEVDAEVAHVEVVDVEDEVVGAEADEDTHPEPEPVADHADDDAVVVDESSALGGVTPLAGRLLRFGVAADETEEPSLGSGEPSFSHIPAIASSVEEEKPSTEAADRYSALRAAMVEVGENLVPDAAADHGVDSPLYAIDEDPEVDSRAALQALLSEVTDAPHDDHVDGLADRGPWTDHELATMDSEHGWSEDEAGDRSNIVPFAAAHATSNHADAEEDAEAPESEEAHHGEEPMNRGLLLKFLSSVRN